MRYSFQSASHMDDYLPAIADAPEFAVKRDVATGILMINYHFVTNETFPDPMQLTGEAQRLAILRRDCRGIEFDLETGDVVTKKFHKFFGISEKPETQIGAIDWARPHHILEKLDGSLLSAFKRKDGGWQWHTKMGPTEVAAPVTAYVAGCGLAYEAFAEAMREDGKSPLFEWCSRQQRIVIDFSQEQLVLTAVRDNRTGLYDPYPLLCDHARRFGIPLVRTLGTVTDIHDFVRDVGALEGAEGYVVRFDDGHAVKIKGEWYSRIHRSKELLVHEKSIWDLLLHQGLDDAKPFMLEADRQLIESFAEEFYHCLRMTAARLTAIVADARVRYSDKKQFAIEGVNAVPAQERGLLFRIWDGHDAWNEVTNYLVKNVGTQTKVDAVRPFVNGLSWRDFYGNVVE